MNYNIVSVHFLMIQSRVHRDEQYKKLRVKQKPVGTLDY